MCVSFLAQDRMFCPTTSVFVLLNLACSPVIILSKLLPEAFLVGVLPCCSFQMLLGHTASCCPYRPFHYVLRASRNSYSLIPTQCVDRFGKPALIFTAGVRCVDRMGCLPPTSSAELTTKEPILPCAPSWWCCDWDSTNALPMTATGLGQRPAECLIVHA